MRKGGHLDKDPGHGAAAGELRQRVLDVAAVVALVKLRG